MKYNALSYWEQRGEDYRDPPSRLEDPGELPNLIRWVKQTSPGNILEVGSGWGRIYLALRGAGLTFKNFKMCDIAQSMARGCEERTGVRPDLWDGRTLPYPDSSFDLVISFSVLLHVPPADLERSLGEHVRVSRRHIFVATCIEAEKPLAPHCFVHDYAKIFRLFSLAAEKKREFAGRNWVRIHWLLGMRRGTEGIESVTC